MKVWDWVVQFVAGLATGREPVVWAGIALAFITDTAQPLLEQAASASDTYELIGILLGAFAVRSQFTPLKNRT